MAYTTIKKPSDYFNTKLYTGTGSAQDITGLDFQPDFNWIKRRNTTGSHRIQDAVRGSTKYLASNSTDNEVDAGDVDAFLSNGFSLDSGSTAYNASGSTYVSWNWLGANGTSANTDGTISSTVSVNTTSRFSIVKYTGTGAIATVGHGLGVTPKIIIAKGLGVVNNWLVYTSTTGNNKALALQDSGTGFTGSHLWNDTNPTSSVFSLGAVGATNTSGQENIAYCFADVQGYSKFGSYTGNGNADGTFVYTGFKPAFVIIKRTDATEDWWIHDNKRNTFNAVDKQLYANQSNAEVTETSEDLLSNGFKFRTSNANWNASGGTYIYMAFAEEPLVGDNPATAR